MARITKFLLGAQDMGATIVTSDWKDHIRCFKLPRCRARYNAYDLQLSYPGIDDYKRLKRSVLAMLERMGDCKIHEWQRVLADAGVVYQEMEDTGVLHSGILRLSQWSQRTNTGRSKCKGFTLQGINRKSREHIRSPFGTENDVLLLFDWISADVRFAGLFAEDDVLEQSFRDSDPYSILADRLGLADQDGARNDCKIGLLKGINSMDTDSPVFTVYPKLGAWIDRCRHKLANLDGYLDTFLGRRFKIKDGQNMLQVLNGCMQGSVAHAMQLTVRRIWEEMGVKLLAEVHDSLVIACAPELVDNTIDIVSEIMLRPFEGLYDKGLVDSNPDFPFKVHVGDLWHGWELRSIHRGDCIERVFSGQNTLQIAEAFRAGEEASEKAAGEVDGSAPEGSGAPSRSDINQWFFDPGGIQP